MYPDAKIQEHREDYNPFNEGGVSVSSYATAGGSVAYPLRTFETFTQDPLNVLLSTFSKINRDGEGVAVQFVIRPAGKAFNIRYQGIMEQIKKGTKAKDALKGVGAQFATEFVNVAKSLAFGVSTRKEGEPVEEEAIKNIGEK